MADKKITFNIKDEVSTAKFRMAKGRITIGGTITTHLAATNMPENRVTGDNSGYCEVELCEGAGTVISKFEVRANGSYWDRKIDLTKTSDSYYFVFGNITPYNNNIIWTDEMGYVQIGRTKLKGNLNVVYIP